MMSDNLLQNADFMQGENGAPKGWEPHAPRPALRPAMEWTPGSLIVRGGGNEYGFGYWRQEVPVAGGRTYALKVKLRIDQIDDLNLHVMNMVLWGRDGRPPSSAPMDHVSFFRRDGDLIIGEDTFETPADVTSATVMLGLRFAPGGSVEWKGVELTEAAPPVSRPARLTAVKWRAQRGSTISKNLDHVAKLLDQAGALGSDLFLLPEFTTHNQTNATAYEAAEPVPGGPTGELLAQKAKEHQMNVCAGIIERDGELLFNTAILYDRSGRYVGKHRKNHPYWPEEMWDGISPGDGYPVFDLDIGRIGVVICYDSWYAETSRILALKGAELILLPNAGYEPLLIPARAIDNRVYFVVSSLNTKAMIVDTFGNVRAETNEGLISVTVDLARRPSPHPNAGGSLNASAAGRRALRHAKSDALYREILKEIGTWEERPDRFSWLPR